MPNGGDRNYVRFCAAVDGFKDRYGRWPERVVVEQGYIDDLKEHVLAPGEFDRMQQKLRVLAGNALFRAEDDAGNSYEYGEEGFPPQKPRPSAREWLGLELQPDLGW